MSQTSHGASCVLKQLFTVSHPAGQIQMTRLRVCVCVLCVSVWVRVCVCVGRQRLVGATRKRELSFPSLRLYREREIRPQKKRKNACCLISRES